MMSLVVVSKTSWKHGCLDWYNIQSLELDTALYPTEHHFSICRQLQTLLHISSRPKPRLLTVALATPVLI